jgi:hypothetical protein
MYILSDTLIKVKECPKLRVAKEDGVAWRTVIARPKPWHGTIGKKS